MGKPESERPGHADQTSKAPQDSSRTPHGTVLMAGRRGCVSLCLRAYFA
jgi:hypothetical protein